jgi:hypothetical protein
MSMMMKQQRAAAMAKANGGKLVASRRVVSARAADTMGFKTMRNGVKVASDETLLSPR